ncbi:hypothetical protein SAMN05444340_101249 [Citreimonas salinaria]|uniref:Uncharacterized protein n=1 Tax=Citreimonas salinaria TaxID=321339 RepID=A0A1H3FA26_9RHOB|nr:hypothetical protein SAMN05444340_101249 [Citreimonas salinaria]
MAALEAQLAARDRLPPDIPAIFEAALEFLETLLADPELVAQASEELATLIRSITLIPNPPSEDGLSDKNSMDPGSPRSSVGLPVQEKRPLRAPTRSSVDPWRIPSPLGNLRNA